MENRGNNLSLHRYLDDDANEHEDEADPASVLCRISSAGIRLPGLRCAGEVGAAAGTCPCALLLLRRDRYLAHVAVSDQPLDEFRRLG
jgi:hypothetical protein